MTQTPCEVSDAYSCEQLSHFQNDGATPMRCTISSKVAGRDDPRHFAGDRRDATCEVPAEAAGLFSTFDDPTREEDLDIDRNRFSGVLTSTNSTTLLAGDDCTSACEKPLIEEAMTPRQLENRTRCDTACTIEQNIHDRTSKHTAVAAHVTHKHDENPNRTRRQK